MITRNNLPIILNNILTCDTVEQKKAKYYIKKLYNTNKEYVVIELYYHGIAKMSFTNDNNGRYMNMLNSDNYNGMWVMLYVDDVINICNELADDNHIIKLNNPCMIK